MKRLFSVPAFRFSVGDLASAVGKWSRICTMGAKQKEGADIDFNPDTLSEMVSNAAARGDAIAICADHLSAYIATTGQPAPALGFFDALAVVASGAIVKSWQCSAGTQCPAGLDDGLYARLGEITPRGRDSAVGLGNYKFLSPMFSMAAKGEDGSDIGPALYDVAATNTPFQAGTEIQFSTGRKAQFSGAKMDDTEMAKRFGFEPDDDDEKKKDKMAKFWADYDEKEKASKMAATPAADAPAAMSRTLTAPAIVVVDKTVNPDVAAAKLALLEANNAAFEARFRAMDDAEKARHFARIETLADTAVAGGLAASSRPALVTLAKVDYAAAEKMASQYLHAAPTYLFDRLTQTGGPIGAPASAPAARSVPGPVGPRLHKTPFGTVVAPDEEYADEIKRVAFSKDKDTAAKVDAVLTTDADRASKWARLVAAEKVVKRDRPELVERADRIVFGMAF